MLKLGTEVKWWFEVIILVIVFRVFSNLEKMEMRFDLWLMCMEIRLTIFIVNKDLWLYSPLKDLIS